MDTELVKGTLSLLILSLLSRRQMYGYEIVATVRDETESTFEWKAGSLYPSLHKLERDGLIASQWQGVIGTRRRKYYRLTEAGRSGLAEKVESFVERHGFAFPVVIDVGRQTQVRMNVIALPTTILLNPEGKIVMRSIGYRPGEIDKFRDKIEKMLSQAADE